MSAPRWQEPNLARAPFVNERPVRRLAIVLWLLFAISGGGGIWMSLATRQEAGTRLAELVRLNTESVRARERAAALDRELRASNLPAQNERTEFLNRRLAERSFSWSSLLETLTQAMPRGVRLVRLSPEGFTRERRRMGANVQTAATTRVALRITGEAEETEALLEFVDRLFQHPAFDRPNLSRESEKKDFKIQFELAVAYLPQLAGQQGTAVAGQSGAPPESPEEGAAPTESTVRAAAAPGDRTSAANPALPTSRAESDAAGLPTGSVRGVQGRNGAQAPATADRDEGGTPSAPGSGRRSGAPAGTVPGDSADTARAGRFRPGTTSPAPGGGAQFPANVMPTPLRPYASTLGGGR